MDIPYTVEARPDTRLYNGKLGMWLFLASEVMLFGGMFSAYIFLRTGAPVWPRGADVLNVPLATFNTLVLITSSMTMVMSWFSLKEGNFGLFRRYLFATCGLGVVFLALKSYEYWDKLGHGHYPSESTFYAIYFALTGLHVLHLIGGVLACLWHGLFGKKLWDTKPQQLTNRIEVTGLYWHFVDLVWLVVFPTLYLT